MGTSAAIVANGIGSQSVQTGSISGVGQVSTGTSQVGITGTTGNQQTTGTVQQQTNVENYQFLLPRIFEPNLTEEELQQQEKERQER